MSRQGRGRRARGLTLVELLFAIAVIVLAGVWLLGAYDSSIRLTELSQQAAVALNDARAMAERIKTTPFNSNLPVTFPDGVSGDGRIGSGADVGTGADQYPNVVGRDVDGDGIRDYPLTSELISVAYRDQNGNPFAGTNAQRQTAITAEIQSHHPLQVEVTVTWTSGGRIVTKSLATIKAS